MTTETVSAAMVPSSTAWRSLLWFAPLTTLWILMIYRWPAIPASGVPTTTHQLAAHALIALGLWLGLEHTSLTPDQRRATWLAIFIPDTLWFAIAWSAAVNGAFRTDASPLPVLPLAIFLPASIGAGAYPGVLTCGFVVPSSILLHALSLRQLRRRSKAEAARR